MTAAAGAASPPRSPARSAVAWPWPFRRTPDHAPVPRAGRRAARSTRTRPPPASRPAIGRASARVETGWPSSAGTRPVRPRPATPSGARQAQKRSAAVARVGLVIGGALLVALLIRTFLLPGLLHPLAIDECRRCGRATGCWSTSSLPAPRRPPRRHRRLQAAARGARPRIKDSSSGSSGCRGDAWIVKDCDVQRQRRVPWRAVHPRAQMHRPARQALAYTVARPARSGCQVRDARGHGSTTAVRGSTAVYFGPIWESHMVGR